MKHSLYFYGHSDDIVIAGTDKRSLDEYYNDYFLLNNGLIVRAAYTVQGCWDFDEVSRLASTTAEVTVIPAVDVEDEGIQHTDPRIPHWLEPAGYSGVLIIESDKPLAIVWESATAIPCTGPNYIIAASIAAEINRQLDIEINALRLTPEMVMATFAKFGVSLQTGGEA